jgi:adenylate cyclase
MRAYQWKPELSEAKTTAGVAEAPPAGPVLPDKPSIAVLPFTNMSGDPEQEYFADGLTEDLITALSKFRWFFVIARNSSFTYKSRSTTVQQVGRDLGVRYVLEGSTRKSGQRVLVEAETGHHVWAERYDRSLADLFEVQDEIIEKVVGAIEPEMLRTETLRARRKTPESLTAWDLIFRGMWHFHQLNRDHHRRAQELFRKATQTDFDIAEGHTWLSRCSAGLLFYGWSENPEADAAEGWEAALRGVRLAETDPYAHYAVAIMAVVTGRPKETIEAAQKALDLSPSFALGYLALGLARLFLGDATHSIEPLERGLQLSPHDPQAFVWLQFLAFAHFLSGENDKAARRAREAVAKRPDSFSAYCVLACSLTALGDNGEAKQAAIQMRRILAGGSGLSNLLARFVEPTDRERISQALNRAEWQQDRL